ncbi:hypothetical protein LYSHEL_30130 [Lysobacter helvus]|uniref:DUF2939 domain-containing protein n=2 Tax=Lysobacteraceae TaxID=32033 RepID=A0ABN6FWA6_9GAMM|nr:MULTISPECIES: DUF2939 domain-containing protein [Lysobacter]BCT93986.1 hypothetical protein LYSCAS_30100 [Lysobacter caseinilyticus]BCT97142.1 hypothetical protein LYSHEL_30130 [Lysobacter helvus]
MKKWIALVLALVLLLGAYVAAGPYITIRAIRQAVQAQDAGELAEQVDFPAVRASLKAQLIDAVVRKSGAEMQSNVLGAITLGLVNGVVNGAVDGMVNPAGLAAVMQGRRLWKNTQDSVSRPPLDAKGEPLPTAQPQDPLHDAKMRYESTSRFTATIHDDQGKPIVFVLKRTGLRWRLADIRLPIDD